MYLLIIVANKETEYAFVMHQIQEVLKFVMGDHSTGSGFILWVAVIMGLSKNAFTVLK
jgi:hypothetical protein